MLKKRLSLVLCFVWIALLCACQVPSDESTPTTGEPAVPQWKTAYLEYLEEEKDGYLSYVLIHIDDDGIPELYLSGAAEAIGDCLCSYKNGNLVEQPLNRIGGGRYIENSGDIFNQNGNFGRLYTNVFKLTKDGFSLTFYALYTEEETSATYSVKDKQVTEEEYNAAVDEAFDFARSVPLNENAVEYDVILEQIQNWE